ncbi:MAG: sigma 54-interacting transcriptional regulator [Candidatus Riflebacteria bacterium]
MSNQHNHLPGSTTPIPCGSACEALDFLQQIYNSAPVVMLAVSPDLKIVRLNQRFAKFTGLSAENMLSRPLDEIFPEAFKALSKIIEEVKKWLKPVSQIEISFNHDQHPIFWEVSAWPITDENRALAKINLMLHDISELRLTQSKLEKAYASILELQEKLEQENQLLRREISQSASEQVIIGSSREIQTVMHQISQVAPTDTTVLITGETGTGKELVARAVHNQSRRHDKPLVIVNCAALPANLIESELFGHEKGAFTGAIARKAGRFELADTGTIFLDEIGELPLELQSKLLRVLQENQFERVGGTRSLPVDVRIIAATNRDLALEVRNGRFREDLFFRLNVFPLHLPPLKERGVDIIELADAFIGIFSEKMGRPRPTLSKESVQTLINHSWPGNIRELRNVIERAMILCKTDTILITIPEYGLKPRPAKNSPTFDTDLSLETVEKVHITRILEKCNWKVRGHNGAASVLNLKPTTLESKMKKLQIRRPKP